MRILAVGEIIFDVIGDEAHIGGAPLNFCAHCSSLGAESALISAVGPDKNGEIAINTLAGFGVDTSFVQKQEMPTGQCVVSLRNGVPFYNILFRAAYFQTQITDETVEKIKEYTPDVFAFGTLIQSDLRLRREIMNVLNSCDFSEIFCDINLRPNMYDRESCRNCFENATILKISAEEEPLLDRFVLYKKGKNDEETVRNICKAFDNIKIVIYTMGENGSLIYDNAADEIHRIPAVETQVVSTVGAGDSYSAAFLSEYFKSGDFEKSGRAGAALSAFVVAHKEAVPVISNEMKQL